MLQDWISSIEGWIPALADSLWVYPALTLFALIDGFFPPIPSESVVIALASLSVSHGAPNLALIALAGALGAFAGDQIAYTIGSQVDVHRLRIFRSERGRKALAWAEHALEHRGSSFILAARYIPVGRVAVNMTAGALHYPRRRFVGLTALAGVTWAGYGTAVGVGAGVWLASHPLLAVVAGVVVGTLVGIGIDWVLRRWTGLGRVATEDGAALDGVALDGAAPDRAAADAVTERQAPAPDADVVPRPGEGGPGRVGVGRQDASAGAVSADLRGDPVTGADGEPEAGTGGGSGADHRAHPDSGQGPASSGEPDPGATDPGATGPGPRDASTSAPARTPVVPVPDTSLRPAALAAGGAEPGPRVTSWQRSGPAR